MATTSSVKLVRESREEKEITSWPRQLAAAVAVHGIYGGCAEHPRYLMELVEAYDRDEDSNEEFANTALLNLQGHMVVRKSQLKKHSIL